MSTPPVIARYLAAAGTGDIAALAGCFTEDGTVLDEGHTYTGPAEIVSWRESLARQWTYTTTVTSSEPIDGGDYRVSVRAEGDFPGGVADLTYRFALRDGLISALSIGE
jgi:ketosteroid isomerase-like protein